MSLLNRLRPKWQNSDPEVRVDAVRQLDKNDIELLTAVAQQDTDARVRKVAIKKLDAPRLLLELAETDNDEGVRTSALVRARHLLVHIACDSRDADESTRALELLTEASDIASVADKAHFEAVRTNAFDSLQDDAALSTLVHTAKNPAIRLRALKRVQQPSSLKNIVLDENAGALASIALTRIEDIEVLEAVVDHGAAAKSLRRQALAKLSKLAPDDHPIKVKEREEHFAELCRRVEELEEGAPRPDELAEIESRWSELKSHGAPSDELAQSFDAVATRIRDSATKKLRRAEQSVQAVEAVEEVAEPATELARSTKADDKPEAEPVQPLQLEQLERLEARRQELKNLLAEAESASKVDDPEAASRALTKLSKKWRTLESVADADAKARYAHLEERAHELQETKRREQEAKEQKTLTEIQTCLAKMTELTSSDELSIREAGKALRQAQTLLKTMAPLARSVNRRKIRREFTDAREKLFKKTQDMRTIEDWKRWANIDIQNGLIARIEALRESRDTPKVAKELRVIHEEWKKAGAAPSEQSEELWQRYKSVRDELKVKCDKFFEKQNKDRLENLRKKEALCVEVEALDDSEEWNKTADAIKALQEKWKTIGPAPQKQSDAVWKRFRKACDHFFERRKCHFDDIKGEQNENLKKKEALCELVETVQDSTDWRNTVDELKRLQAEWRTVGPVQRKKSDQVWKRFRKACDHFFDRYKRRDEVELEERQKQREAIVEEATLFAKELPDDANAVASKAKGLWVSWKSLSAVPESTRDVQERFESIVSQLVSGVPNAFADTDLDPATSRKKRERLVIRLETLVNELTGNSTAANEAAELGELEDLARRLKDALASNTMTGGKPREKKLDWRAASDEVRRLKANWLRAAPVPGDEGRALGERFQNAYESFLKQKPK